MASQKPSAQDPYPKLVRDKIPKKIRQQGDTPVLSRLTGKKLLREIKKKLTREAFEAQASLNKKAFVEELGDIQTLIERALKELKISKPEFKKLMRAKNKEKGAFDKGFYIERVD
jgi:predicted house-cleaning noncanonical NTP pyrophosphatase (MazG superfamily)